MNIKEVKDLIHDILQSDINEFELEHTGTRIRLRRGISQAELDGAMPAASNWKSTREIRESGAPPAGAFASPAAPKGEAAEEEGLHIVTSPIVGTFYRAPAPTAEPYIRIGSKVEAGTILCIVEAMKLMNEIPSDAVGEVIEIYVENGHPVEFGQKLFGIRTHK
jgi:acetyl-CoA carboxylase biotin carboxyl carrier protein